MEASPGPAPQEVDTIEEAVELLWAAALPIINAVFMCTIGAVLARRGLLKPEGRQVLNQLGFYVFLPALAFSKLAQSVSWEDLKIWWPLPLNVFINIVLGLGLGWAVARLPFSHTPEELRMHVALCSGLGNANNLPLMVIASMCDDPTSVGGRLGAACQQTGLAYVSFGSWVASVLQFSLASSLMSWKLPPVSSPLQRSASRQYSGLLHQDSDEETHLRPALTRANSRAPRQNGGQHSSSSGADVELAVQSAYGASHPRQQQNGRRNGVLLPALSLEPVDQSGGGHQGGHPDAHVTWWDADHRTKEGRPRDTPGPLEDADEDDLEVIGSRHAGGSGESDGRARDDDDGGERDGWIEQRLHGMAAKIRRQHIQGMGIDISVGESLDEVVDLLERAAAPFHDLTWDRIFPMPTAGALAGLLIGIISPLQRLFYSSRVGDQDVAPLSFVAASLNILGGAAIPSTMLVLGTVLAHGPERDVLPLRTIVSNIAVKQVVVPAIGLVLVVVAIMLGVFRPPTQLFVFVLLLNYAMPTAVNMSTVAVMHKSGEAEVAALLFWQYAAAVLLLPLWMTAFEKVAVLTVGR